MAISELVRNARMDSIPSSAQPVPAGSGELADQTSQLVDRAYLSTSGRTAAYQNAKNCAAFGQRSTEVLSDPCVPQFAGGAPRSFFAYAATYIQTAVWVIKRRLSLGTGALLLVLMLLPGGALVWFLYCLLSRQRAKERGLQ